MPTYSRGDVISFSRAQVSRVSVVQVPPGPGPATYTVNLPINGVARPFTVQAQPGASLAAIAAGLLAVLLDQQTVYAASLEVDPTQILLTGPLGATYTVSTTSNMVSLLVQDAVLVVNQQTGEQIGPVRLTEVTDTLNQLRHFWTRLAPDGVLEERLILRGREIGTSNVFDFDSRRVLTVLA